MTPPSLYRHTHTHTQQTSHHVTFLSCLLPCVIAWLVLSTLSGTSSLLGSCFVAFVWPECLLILRAVSPLLCKTSPTITQWQQLLVIALVCVCVHMCFFFAYNLNYMVLRDVHTVSTHTHARAAYVRIFSPGPAQQSRPLLLALDSTQKIGAIGCITSWHCPTEPCHCTRDSKVE